MRSSLPSSTEISLFVQRTAQQLTEYRKGQTILTRKQSFETPAGHNGRRTNLDTGLVRGSWDLPNEGRLFICRPTQGGQDLPADLRGIGEGHTKTLGGGLGPPLWKVMLVRGDCQCYHRLTQKDAPVLIIRIPHCTTIHPPTRDPPPRSEHGASSEQIEVASDADKLLLVQSTGKRQTGVTQKDLEQSTTQKRTQKGQCSQTW